MFQFFCNLKLNVSIIRLTLVKIVVCHEMHIKKHVHRIKLYLQKSHFLAIFLFTKLQLIQELTPNEVLKYFKDFKQVKSFQGKYLKINSILKQILISSIKPIHPALYNFLVDKE